MNVISCCHYPHRHAATPISAISPPRNSGHIVMSICPGSFFNCCYQISFASPTVTSRSYGPSSLPYATLLHCFQLFDVRLDFLGIYMTELAQGSCFIHEFSHAANGLRVRSNCVVISSHRSSILWRSLCISVVRRPVYNGNWRRICWGVWLPSSQ
jgi:hypothetical protein